MIYDDEGNAVRNEDGTPVGSVDVNELSDAQADTAAEVDDLSKLYKADLVARAEAAGIDTEGMTKAELVEALEGHDSEPEAS